MRAKHIDRTKWVRQIGSGMKGGCLPALFMAFVFIAHPRLLAAQDAQYEADAQYAQDGPIDESAVAATIATADADLENDQASADKSKQGDKADGTAEDSSQTALDSPADSSADQAQNQSADGSPTTPPSSAEGQTSDAKRTDDASPALDSSAASASRSEKPQPDANSQNASQMNTATAAPASAPAGEAVAPSGPKSEIALNTATLMKLANDLKSEVDKTSKDTLSLTVVREADKIEQLARKMRTK